MANLYDDGTQGQAPQAFTPSAGANSSPSPDITVAPGYTPDYSALLAGNSGLVAAKNSADANQQAGDAARQAQVRSQFVQYGGDIPAGWTDKYGDIDQATRDAAAGNSFSTIANLKRNYATSVDQFRKALSARGMLDSSELGYGQDSLDRGLGQNEYDAANAFTGGIASDYGTYAGVLGQNARDLASAVGAAQGNVFANPANRPVAPTTAHYDTSSSAQYGKPIYTDEWGTKYDQYGNVLVQGTPPAPPAPAAPTGDGGGGGTDTSGYAASLSQPLDPNAPTITYNAPPPSSAAYQPTSAQQAAQIISNTYSPFAGAASIISDKVGAPVYEPYPVSGYAAGSKANVH